jgi:hypothetical protein
MQMWEELPYAEIESRFAAGGGGIAEGASETMSARRGEAKGGQSPRDAVDWFVENESDPEPDPIRLREWETWSASLKNRADYAEIILMREEARTLSAPPTASRQELLADITDETSVASIIGPWD